MFDKHLQHSVVLQLYTTKDSQISVQYPQRRDLDPKGAVAPAGKLVVYKAKGRYCDLCTHTHTCGFYRIPD